MTFPRLLQFSLLVVTFGCNADKVRQLETENQELAAKLDRVTKEASLELQKKCPDNAAAAFKDWGWHNEPSASYSNHYQQKLSKCFVQISNITVEDKIQIAYAFVQDAFTGKSYGEYLWVTGEVKPLCRVTLLSGEETLCQSREEFHDLIKVYMEEALLRP